MAQCSESVCIKADRCVNKPAGEQAASLSDMDAQKRPERVLALVLLAGAVVVLPSPFFSSTHRSEFVKKSQQNPSESLPTPDGSSGVSITWSRPTGCTAAVSRPGVREAGSSEEGPWWARGGWLQTGSHLRGLRSLGTGRGPATKQKNTQRRLATIYSVTFT